jgi:hypothetical protein
MNQDPVMVAKYLCNPDVVLREEDDDGGLLFNPDTNQVKVINSTGLLIWKQCESVCGVEEVVKYICQMFDDVPQSEIEQDVREFIDGMVQTGFFGTALSEK